MVERTPFEATYETCIANNVILLLFLIPQIGKCVNDDTKNEIENNNNNAKVEEHIINDADHELNNSFVNAFEIAKIKKPDHCPCSNGARSRQCRRRFAGPR